MLYFYDLNQYHLYLTFSKGSLTYNFTWDYGASGKSRKKGIQVFVGCWE